MRVREWESEAFRLSISIYSIAKYHYKAKKKKSPKSSCLVLWSTTSTSWKASPTKCAGEHAQLIAALSYKQTSKQAIKLEDASPGCSVHQLAQDSPVSRCSHAAHPSQREQSWGATAATSSVYGQEGEVSCRYGWREESIPFPQVGDNPRVLLLTLARGNISTGAANPPHEEAGAFNLNLPCQTHATFFFFFWGANKLLVTSPQPRERRAAGRGDLQPARNVSSVLP